MVDIESENNMYPEYQGKTINFIGGACPHACGYCYAQSFTYPSLKERYSGKTFLIEKAFKIPLGNNKRWFPCSCCDWFANTIPWNWIARILKHLNTAPTNEYLIQSKNPARFPHFIPRMPPKAILGTTIETNRYEITDKYSKAPTPGERFEAMCKLPKRIPKMISVEPIMDFDLDAMVCFIQLIGPQYVSIGADSKGHNLPEPTPEKVGKLVRELEKITEVRIKSKLVKRGLYVN